MKTVILSLVLAGLFGCGVETVGSAATAAAMKKQELEQGRAAMDKVQQQLQEASRQTAQRAAQADEAK